MAVPPPPPRSLLELARRGGGLGDGDLDPTLGAALVARDVYGGLDVDGLLARFDDLAAPAIAARLGGLEPREQAVRLAHHVFELLEFRGNEADYYDPRNSLLPDVLDRRLGIPISLAVVYCEIARRAGVHARGVSFPGHFLVRIDAAAPADDDGDDAEEAKPGLVPSPVVVDPFAGGRLLAAGDGERLLRRTLGAGASLSPAHLAPASGRAIVLRMLANLKFVYLTRGDSARAYIALDRIVALSPDAPDADAVRKRLEALDRTRPPSGSSSAN